MGNHKILQNETVEEDWAISSFAFEPLATLHERTDNIRDDIFREGSGDNKKALASVILTLVLLVTVSTQIRKVSNSNPVNGLKTD